MKVERTGNVVTVEGQPVKPDDNEAVKSAVREVPAGESVELVFTDALTINSSLIGFLLKSVREDGMDISVKAVNYKLLDMLKMLSIDGLLKAGKI